MNTRIIIISILFIIAAFGCNSVNPPNWENNGSDTDTDTDGVYRNSQLGFLDFGARLSGGIVPQAEVLHLGLE